MSDTAEITSIHQMTPDVKQFQFELKDVEWEYKPGQHTVIHFEQDGEEVSRPYTPTNLPGDGTDQFTLAIRKYEDGTASTFMHDREPGDEVEVDEPHGNLYIRDYYQDVVLIGTGTGITPLMAMLRDYLERGTGEVYLFFGEKTQEHIIYRESFDHLEAEHDNLTVIYSLDDEEWNGPEGFIQEHLDTHLEGFEDRHFYICGVPQMVVDTKQELERRDVDESRIFSEGWEEDAV
ncbi:MAG: FAD-dependent oxidoreductase [Candidatus Nanohaloarchaea archaeon]|nr:FAD-dependent oxidoreductase [Candidatus Nanohaloarchaea archaeon]